MKILFVVPCYPKRIREYLILPSIELCIMSSVLKQRGHEISLLDMQINDYKIDDIESLLRRYDPDLLCVEDGLQVHCNSRKVLQAARKVYGDEIPLCIRGEIPSFVPQTTMERNPELDIILRYETDDTLLRVIDAMEGNLSLADIPDIAYRSRDGIVVTRRRETPLDLTKLPKADRRLYDIEKYLRRDSETIAKSSRGCVGSCAFCTKTRFESYRQFPMFYFCDEIAELQSLGFRTFFFSDNIFAVTMDRLRDFQRELERRDLQVSWTSNIRIKDITDEKIALMKKLGAYRVFIGIETINESSSSLIHKNLRRQEILDKIEILHRHQMEFHASFILGSPGDTEADLQETIGFVHEIRPTLVTFNLLKVFPGLPIYDDPEAYGIVMPDKYWYESDEWAGKVVMGTHTLPPEKLEKWSKKMLFSFVQAGG